MRVLALVVLCAVLVAISIVEYRVLRDWTRQIARPPEGWLWERSWQRQALGWGGLALGLGFGVALIIKFPPGSAAEPYVRFSLLIVSVAGALLLKRRNRRDGVKAVPPLGHHGPPGWEWDPDRVTWRPPK